MIRSVALIAPMLIAAAVPLLAQPHPSMVAAEQGTQAYDVIVRGGTVYDGTGGPGRAADVGIRGDRIAAIGDLAKAQSKTVLDAKGWPSRPASSTCCPGPPIRSSRTGARRRDPPGRDPRVMGEGSSMGPLTDEMKRRAVEQQGDVRYDITWTTLAEYLAFLEKKGISTNVASYIGAATIREYVVGLDDRPAPPRSWTGCARSSAGRCRPARSASGRP